MRKLLFTFLLCLFFAVGYSQVRTLVLFTKPDCNNCNYTKHNLKKAEVMYSEFSLDDKDNAVLMLQKLKELNYSAKIYLPVIIENDSILLHPQAYNNDSTLFFVVKNIVSNNNSQTDIDLDDADCDFNVTYKYLVCGNFKEKADAENFKSVLLNDAYPHAGIIFYKKMYRVYAMQVFEYENDVYYLEELRKKYRGAYYLENSIK